MDTTLVRGATAIIHTAREELMGTIVGLVMINGEINMRLVRVRRNRFNTAGNVSQKPMDLRLKPTDPQADFTKAFVACECGSALLVKL